MADAQVTGQPVVTPVTPALPAVSDAVGGFGSLAQPNSARMGGVVNDPGYAWREQRGQQALERSAAAKGTLMTGGTLRDTMDYAQGLASQEYSNAWDRAYREWMGQAEINNQDRNFQFGSLSTMAGMGLNAANNYASGLYGGFSGAGNAQAAGTAAQGAANAGIIRDVGQIGSAGWMWGANQYQNSQNNPTVNATNSIANRLGQR
jgi:hypothetical protein